MANKIYRVYTRWLALELRKLGFKIIGTDINETHPQFDVWLFSDTKELHEAILALTAGRKAQ